MRPAHWLTVQQAAEALGFTEQTIRDYCHAGVFPNAGKASENPRSSWRIPEDDIKNFGKHRAEAQRTTLDHKRRRQLLASRRTA